MRKIAIGADDAAIGLRDRVVSHLKEKGLVVTDFSPNAQGDYQLYPDVAWSLASAIQEGQFERGILLCGTGIGMAIVANKVPGIRAAQCHDVYSAERARKSNNAQIITLGARVVGTELALTLIDTWLTAEFEAGRSAEKVDRIAFYDARHHS